MPEWQRRDDGRLSVPIGVRRSSISQRRDERHKDRGGARLKNENRFVAESDRRELKWSTRDVTGSDPDRSARNGCAFGGCGERTPQIDQYSRGLTEWTQGTLMRRYDEPAPEAWPLPTDGRLAVEPFVLRRREPVCAIWFSERKYWRHRRAVSVSRSSLSAIRK